LAWSEILSDRGINITTIENFFIAHKIERVNELLVYNELNLTERINSRL